MFLEYLHAFVTNDKNRISTSVFLFLIPEQSNISASQRAETYIWSLTPQFNFTYLCGLLSPYQCCTLRQKNDKRGFISF